MSLGLWNGLVMMMMMMILPSFVRRPGHMVTAFGRTTSPWSTSATASPLLSRQDGRLVRSMASVSGTVYTSNTKDKEDNELLVITLFTKEGCTLCDKVKEVLQDVRLEIPHTLVQFDITDETDSAKQYFDKYKYDIPVLHVNGMYWAKHRLTPQQAMEDLRAVQQQTFVSPTKEEPNASKMERT